MTHLPSRTNDNDQMAEAHRQDMRDGQALLWLCDVLEDFLADPPSRSREQTQERARELLASVRQDMDQMPL